MVVANSAICSAQGNARSFSNDDCWTVTLKISEYQTLHYAGIALVYPWQEKGVQLPGRRLEMTQGLHVVKGHLRATGEEGEQSLDETG